MSKKFIPNQKYLQALTGTEYGKNNNVPSHGNIATIGDSLLSFVALDYINKKYGLNKLNKEELTDLKKLIQDNSILNILGKELFDNFVRKDNNDFNTENTKNYATTVEAYIYELFLDKSLKACYSFVKVIIKHLIKYLKINEPSNKYLPILLEVFN